MWDGHLDLISVAKHRIKLLDERTQPVHLAPYYARPRTQEFEETGIEKMFKDSTIEPAQTERPALMVFAHKMDGPLPSRVDYRRLNTVAKQDSYTIPRMDKCMDSSGDVAIFSTLDANSKYLQIVVDKVDSDKTALTSHIGWF